MIKRVVSSHVVDVYKEVDFDQDLLIEINLVTNPKTANLSTSDTLLSSVSISDLQVVSVLNTVILSTRAFYIITLSRIIPLLIQADQYRS